VSVQIEVARDAIRQQFGAAIDSLEGVIRACPEDLWTAGKRWYQPWYLAFHTLFWLDLYLSESMADYLPPAPFTRGELEAGVFPERPYQKRELLDWLVRCRQALDARLSTVATDQGFRRPCSLSWGEMEAGELLLYNLRHVQHHVGQINLLIRQGGGEPAPWVARAVGLADDR
jgi:DinB family protein